MPRMEIPHDKYQIAKTGKRVFTAAEWAGFTEKEQQDILMEYRLAYCGYGEVNWCRALGTVLANDEGYQRRKRKEAATR